MMHIYNTIYTSNTELKEHNKKHKISKQIVSYIYISIY